MKKLAIQPATSPNYEEKLETAAKFLCLIITQLQYLLIFMYT